MSPIKSANEFTVSELKEILKALGQSVTGTKAELIGRLMAEDPSGGWMSSASGGSSHQEISDPDSENTSSPNIQRSTEDWQREVDFYRREKELAEREVEMARREIELLRRLNDVNVQVPTRPTVQDAFRKVNVNSIAELLSNFDGSNGAYDKWEQQVRLLQTTYKLDQQTTKVLIGTRLKDKALDWFHSKPEHIEMTVDDLLKELKSMFFHRESKVVLRKRFEDRVWQKGEAFSEYFHEKIILANRIPINNDEIVDYIVDGISDLALRDQARIHCFDTTASLLEAFEKVTLRKGTPNINNGAKSNEQVAKQQKTDVKGGTSSVQRCYNCGKLGHVSVKCPFKLKGLKCFSCGEFGHTASRCVKKQSETKQTNAVRNQNPVSRSQKKFIKDVVINCRSVRALIDTGCDISLMRADQYIKIGSPPLREDETSFRGVGSDDNKTLGILNIDVAIDENSYSIKVYIVTDTLIQYGLLIGADFLNTVEVHIKNGRISISRLENDDSSNPDMPEIFLIDDIREVNTVDVASVPNEYEGELREIISNYRIDKTCEVNVKMNLILTDDEPVYQRPRRLSMSERELVNIQINEWLREGIIQASLSEYASPIVLVKKKNGTTRLCVDYRQLNKKIVKDRYPLPLIEDQIDSLQGARIYSTLDLRNGFFHVAVSDNSRKYTSFIVPDGQYEFLKVPFGLCNSPAIFQRFINAIFRELIAEKIVLTYMDDLIIPSADLKSGLKNLKAVLSVACKHGLSINWDKCSFLKTEVEYLGYVVSNGCIRPSEFKTRAVMKFATPKDIKQVQRFLGLTGYFRKFIHQYSIIARPLSNLLRANATFEWNASQANAFEQLKTILSSKPVLRLYNVKAETELHTDACMYGYGAILLQRDQEDSGMHPVYYASGKTTESESRYTSYELEVLAIVKALKKFRVYLLGIEFKIVTDCQAFVMTMNKKNLCVRVARWALLLEEFKYSIEHRPGKSMSHVDALSRNPLPSCLVIDECEDGLIARLRKAQSDDNDIQKIINLVQHQQAEDFIIKNGLLVKQCEGDVRIVVPKAMQSQIIKRVHDNGHFGINKTETLLKRDYWFRDIRRKVEKVIRNCINCILAEKKQGKQEGFLHPIDKGDLPLDTYHIDHAGPLPSTKKSYCYIFAVIDSFSKFVWLYATKTTNTAEVLDRLRKQAGIFGNPRRIISDRGSAFTSGDFEKYCNDEGIQHTLITTGVPRANGQIERVNRTLKPLLTKLAAPEKGEWYKYLEIAQQYLNATPSRTTNTSPFNLLFGTRMRMKDDPIIREMIENEWTTMFQDDRDELRRQAKEKIAKVQEDNKKGYNKRRKPAIQYKSADLVAIYRTQIAPGSKLAAKYLGPYEVTKVLRNDRYAVQKVGEHDGPRQTTTTAEYMKPWIHYESNESFTDEDI